MPAVSLPAVPNLEQLKHQAKDLVKRVKARDPEAARRVLNHLPRLEKSQVEQVFANPPTLSESQFIIARELGFLSWPKLKRHLDELAPDFDAAVDAFKRAVYSGDTVKLRALLGSTPGLADKINEPWFHFDSPAILTAASKRDRAMTDLLLEYGADINAKSHWWAGGFGVLPCDDLDFAAFLIERGAIVDACSAAGLDMRAKLAELIAADPTVVKMRGGDGQTPLHFAKSIDIAAFLLDNGAEIDARDIDHGSTPAQYMAADRPDICRYLISRGAETDLFMAVQLGDLELVKKIIAADPASIQARVGGGKLTSGDSNGGHIYVYTLKNGHSPLYLAAELGYKDIAALLLGYSTPVDKLLVACLSADEPAVMQLLSEHPGIVQSLAPEQMRTIADAAWSHKTDAVRLMLKIGFDVEARGDHESTALNRAAVRGFADLIELLLAHGASLKSKNEFGGLPLGACIWGSENFRDPHGDYPASVEKMLDAGAPLADLRYPSSNKPVNAVLRRHLDKLSKQNILAAIKLGKADRVAALLDGDPSLINRTTSGILPLYQAVLSNEPEIVKLLLERRADVTVTQKDGGPTVLDEALKTGHAEIAEILRSESAQGQAAS